MARRIVVMEDSEIEKLLNGEEIDISFEKPFTKITLVNEKGYDILRNGSGKTLKEVKDGYSKKGV